MKSYIGITGCSGSLVKTLLKIGKKKFVCFSGDVRNRDHVLKWITKNNLKAVIHLAAISNDPAAILNSKITWETNVLYTLHLLNVCKMAKIKQFMFASSGSVYGISRKNKIELQESQSN